MELLVLNSRVSLSKIFFLVKLYELDIKYFFFEGFIVFRVIRVV